MSHRDESTDFSVDLYDLVTPIAHAVDAMSAAVSDHHLRVACLAQRLARELALPETTVSDVLLAAALHDIGAFSLDVKLDLMEFEDLQPGEHALAGYILLRDFEPFAVMADMIRFHHVRWRHGQGSAQDGAAVPEGAHLIHLADRAAVQVASGERVGDQLPRMRERLSAAAGEVFAPRHVEALLDIPASDEVWAALGSGDLAAVFRRAAEPRPTELDLRQMLEFARLLCRVIDFRSEFTATHSSGVAATAVALARHVGFEEADLELVEIAGYLHDLGKLAVPSEILEKTGKLTEDEWSVMRSHAHFSYQILDQCPALDVVKTWGALHQERLDGSGYPFGYSGDELGLGTRVLAVSDVFTALTEDRPYRQGMPRAAASACLQQMVRGQVIDADTVAVVEDHFEELDKIRQAAQAAAVREFAGFQAGLQGG